MQITFRRRLGAHEGQVAEARLGLWLRFKLAIPLVPWVLWLPLSYHAALDEVRRGEFIPAQKRLLRLLARLPEPLVDVVPAKLLLARALLETGEPGAAAALFPEAFRAVQQPRRSTNTSERSFLKYVSNQIYERATQQLGRPSSFQVEVSFDELDLTHVGKRLQSAFPVTPPHRLTNYH